MDREKVKLPRHVAEAIERIKNLVPLQLQDAFILFEACRYDVKDSSPWSVLNQFVRESENIFKLAEALKYGYEIEPEPITVTVTAEQIEKIKGRYRPPHSSAVVAVVENAWRLGFTAALDEVGIKIPGVNA